MRRAHTEAEPGMASQGMEQPEVKEEDGRMSTVAAEIREGKRFEFGKNWTSYLNSMNEERIAIAERSIRDMLEIGDLGGKTVLDIGSGSGLFSLAARRLDASVVSFDFDPLSVACTRELRRRYFPEDGRWRVEEGSVLDGSFVESLGEFDIVYSWGVLHHTGNLWKALENAASRVTPGGLLFIALYNDAGRASRFWKRVKKTYCSGRAGRWLVTAVFVPYFFFGALRSSLRAGRNVFKAYKANRGMSLVHDWFDWLGGYPFEVSSATEVFRFCRDHGFTLQNLKTTNGGGNNEFVFQRTGAARAPR